MESYEKKIKEDLEAQKSLPKKLEISLLKYYWQVSPHNGRQDNIPKFLRSIGVLKNFSDADLQIFSKYLHYRTFAENEVIFNKGDFGIGFYFIYSGRVDLEVENNHVLSLEKMDYFGELALLQQNSLRNASARARESCELLGIFSPDLSEMTHEYPVIAAKLLQSISIIVAKRLLDLTREVQGLKERIEELEKGKGAC